MITFAIIRHPEVKLPSTPEDWIPYYQHLYNPPISARGRKDAIRIAKAVDQLIKKYLSNYTYGNIYHSHTLRCKQMSEILAEHGPFKKSVFELGLSDPIQSWLLQAVKDELAGKKILNHEWWIASADTQDTQAKLKTETPQHTYQRVTRVIDRLIAKNSSDNKILGLVLPSVLIQLIVAYLTGIDPTITTAKFPFDKASLTLVSQDGKLHCSNVKM